MANTTPNSNRAIGGGRRLRTWHGGLALMVVGAALALAGTVRTTSSSLRDAATDTVPVTVDSIPVTDDTIPVVTDSVPVTQPATLPPTTVAITTSTVKQEPPANATTTIAPAVLPAHILPTSGSNSTPVIVLGVVLLAMGLALTVIGRARDRRAGI